MSRRPDLLPADVPDGYFRFSAWRPDGELFLTWRIHFRTLDVATLLVHAVIDGRPHVSLWREGEESVCYEARRKRKIKLGDARQSLRANAEEVPQP